MPEQQGRTALSSRLRMLRTQHWPRRPVTQGHLASALGVSVPLISSYENGQSVPSEDRLDAYARFFASHRSVDSGGPRLLDDGELTDDERQHHRRLLSELLELRESSVSGPETGALGGHFYHFPDGLPVRIIAPRLPSYELMPSPPTRELTEAARRLRDLLGEDAPDGSDAALAELERHVAVVPVLRHLADLGASRRDQISDADWNLLARGFKGGGVQYANPWHPNAILAFWDADLDAVTEIVGHVRAENPASDVRWLLASEVTADDLTAGHVIIVGGGDSLLTRASTVTPLSFLYASLELPVTTNVVPNGDPEYDWYFEVSVDDQGRPGRAGVGTKQYAPQFLVNGRGQRLYSHGEPLLDHDLALFARITNPQNVAATLTICTGIFSRGSFGAVRIMTDASRRADNERFMQENDVNTSNFWMLLEVPVFYGPQGGVTLTPDLWQRKPILVSS